MENEIGDVIDIGKGTYIVVNAIHRNDGADNVGYWRTLEMHLCPFRSGAIDFASPTMVMYQDYNKNYVPEATLPYTEPTQQLKLSDITMQKAQWLRSIGQ